MEATQVHLTSAPLTPESLAAKRTAHFLANPGELREFVEAAQQNADDFIRLNRSHSELLEALELARDYVSADLAHRKQAYAGWPHRWSTEQDDLDTVDAVIVRAAAAVTNPIEADPK